MVRVMVSVVLNTLVGVLLGSLALLATCSSATTEKKFHNKRQATSYMFDPQHNGIQSQYPAYYPATRYYQYNPSYRNSGHTMQPLPPERPPFVASSPYAQTLRARPQKQYISYYYPHQTHFKDWSQKVLQAGNYARKWQNARKQKLLLLNQKANQGSIGKFFVAGINKNRNMQGEWVGRNQFQKPNDGNTMNVKIAPLSNSPSDSQLKPQLVANPPTSHIVNQQSQTQVNPVSTNTNLAAEVASGTQQKQTSSFHDQGSRANANSNQAILSDNLGGAVLGPNAHSLLQSATSHQTTVSSTLANNQGRVGTTSNSSTKQSPETIVLNNGIPRQKQTEEVLSDNKQNTLGNKPSVQTNSNSQPLKNSVSPPLGASLSTKVRQELTPANSTGFADRKIKSLQRSSQNSEDLPLDTHNMDKTAAQMLNSRLTSISASRPQSEATFSPKPASNAVPNDINGAVTINSASDKTGPNKALINRELALKNILFPPPSVTRNQPSVVTQKNVTPQQIVPSFPAFRYNENRPVTEQSNFNTYRRDRIAHPPNRMSLVPQSNPVPYKSSFPLMLHKISPYFKMKRNLKQMASEQAKARRRFLELQTIE